ncbi:MAG: HAD family hydrolase [Gemmatimonas sp.]
MRRAVFLDRDGVINRAFVRGGKPYPPDSVDTLEILDGVKDALTRLHNAGYQLLVVTNQPDVARGTQRLDVIEAMHERLRLELPLDEILACYHDGDDCECRKPKPGALLAAAERLQLDLTGSFMVGDRWRDIEAGQRAGCQSVFIDYGYKEQQPVAPFARVASLTDAANWILSKHPDTR